MKAVWIPTLAQLDQMYSSGLLPHDIGAALELREAASLVAQMPPVRAAGELMPAGYGLLPPRRAEPWIRLKYTIDEAFGRKIPSTDTGVLGCMWRAGDRVVYRLWFNGHQEPNAHAIKPELRGPVDVYDDAIRSVKGLAGVVPSLTGWCYIRLDA